MVKMQLLPLSPCFRYFSELDYGGNNILPRSKSFALIGLIIFKDLETYFMVDGIYGNHLRLQRKYSAKISHRILESLYRS